MIDLSAYNNPSELFESIARDLFESIKTEHDAAFVAASLLSVGPKQNVHIENTYWAASSQRTLTTLLVLAMETSTSFDQLVAWTLRPPTPSDTNPLANELAILRDKYAQAGQGRTVKRYELVLTYNPGYRADVTFAVLRGVLATWHTPSQPVGSSNSRA